MTIDKNDMKVITKFLLGYLVYLKKESLNVTDTKDILRIENEITLVRKYIRLFEGTGK